MSKIRDLALAVVGGCFVTCGQAVALTTTFTSSAAFSAATAGDVLTVEQYASGTAGQTIGNGGSFNGLTYNFIAGPSGTLSGGIITDQFNSFSGLSLGGDQSGAAQFFFGGDSFTVTFPVPIKAVGIFFNVNANSGNFDVNTPVGNVSTGSAVYDTSTFVFAGLVSTDAFSTITVFSEDAALGSYNIPEIEFAPTPLPATLPLFATGLAGLGWLTRRGRKQAA